MKAIIFDFDGTLANTLPICYYAFQSVFKEYDNREITPSEIIEMFGPSEVGILRKNLLSARKDEAIEYFYQQYARFHKDLVIANKDIHKIVTLLKEMDIKLGIFTGKAKRSLDISLEKLDMEGLFDCLITGDDVSKPKPDPEGLVKALSLLKVESSEAIFVGDSDADIIAGVQANVFTIGVQWLPEYQTATFSEQPNLLISSVTEFENYVKAGVR
ncbi:HAD family hydrolase [Sporosarcina thermotolerans]|uniref:HAD family hydrolase n=1 Tax=Sporosarcina thermotolerans TaxID=633404 RepID=A0AAW9ACK3_9BACL|nr:HAD family hydrolase [Sporosarcina thermotolerans]MDW0117934.1 HAD family hydrolase [Sporosarcina thermotolerans]